ncbi:MAG: type II secretion system F family protein [Burkholderiaceae bacterium]
MRFRILATHDGQSMVTLPVDADNAKAAELSVRQQGYAVIKVSGALPALKWSARERKFPLAQFSHELRSLLEAGLTLPEAMQSLVEKEARPSIRRVLDGAHTALMQGASFSAALATQEAAFPPLYIASIRASEKTGDLPEALARYLAYEQQTDAVRKKVVGASVYPAILIAVGLLVALFLLVYVVPRFAAVYEDTGRDLPWMSALMLAWGRFLDHHALTVVLAVVAAIAMAMYSFSQPSVRSAIERRVLAIPRVGERMRIYQLARLYRTLGMLLRGGMPAIQAMRSASPLLRPELRERLAQAQASVERGRAMSDALDAAGLTTPVALRMLRVGERTGRMHELMERIAAYYEEDTARAIEWFTRLFEPILMLVIGGLIGGIVLLMYLPIFDLAGSLR